MTIDLSTERKEQARVFYQNEHNLASKIWVSYAYVKFPQLFILFFLSPSSLSQREDLIV